MTPLRQWTGWHALARLRRMLGLFTFFYGVLHFLCFAWLDMGLDLAGDRAGHRQAPVHPGRHRGAAADAAAGGDLVQPRHQGAGRERWQALHRAVYATALLAMLHFFWMRAGKNDFAEVAVYAAVLARAAGLAAVAALSASAATA